MNENKDFIDVCLVEIEPGICNIFSAPAWSIENGTKVVMPNGDTGLVKSRISVRKNTEVFDFIKTIAGTIQPLKAKYRIVEFGEAS